MLPEISKSTKTTHEGAFWEQPSGNTATASEAKTNKTRLRRAMILYLLLSEVLFRPIKVFYIGTYGNFWVLFK